MKRNKLDPVQRVLKTMERSKEIAKKAKALSDSGICQRCRKNPHSNGPGATTVYCAECAEKAREYGRRRYRALRGKSVFSEKDPKNRGRKRIDAGAPKPEPTDQNQP